MLVLIRKIKYHLTILKKDFLITCYLDPYSYIGLQKNKNRSVKKREF